MRHPHRSRLWNPEIWGGCVTAVWTVAYFAFWIIFLVMFVRWCRGV